MKTIAQGIRSLAADLGLLAAIVLLAARIAHAAAAATPESVIRTWPAPERAAAGAMLAKYGAPNQFDRRALVWFNNGSWKRTIVYRRPLHHSTKAPGMDFLQQTVGYIVPNDKVPLLTLGRHIHRRTALALLCIHPFTDNRCFANEAYDLGRQLAVVRPIR